MELTCPHCHARNRFDAERAARTSRYICASCQNVFEAEMGEGAFRAASPEDVCGFAPVAAAPAGLDDVLDIFDAPPTSFEDELEAEPPSQVLEDLYLSLQPAADARRDPADEMAAAFDTTPPTFDVTPSAPFEEPAPPPASPASFTAAPADFDFDAPAAAEEADPLHITEPDGERHAESFAPRAEESFAPAAAFASAEVEDAAESFAEPVAFADDAASEPARVAPPAPAFDKYAVGMRVLRVSPTWLLLSGVGFFAVLLTLSWMSRPVGPVAEAVAAGAKLPNEATRPVPKRPAGEPVALTEAAKSAAEKAQPPAPRESAKPAAEPSRPEAAEFGASGGKFTVQVGSFNNPSEANELVSQLRGAGFAARSVAVELPGRGAWYRVQAGRFESREEAAQAGAQMRAKGAASAVLVTEIEKQ